MKTLGRVVRVQVQREPLKVGTVEDGVDMRTYRTEPILTMARLHLTPEGAVGLTDSGSTVVDVHNSTHPKTRFTGKNPLSFNFTHHYTQIRDRFGAHIADGNAGENILIEADDKTDALYIPTGRIGIQSAATGEILILEGVIPAPPCAPFTYFCAQARVSGKDMREALQYLDDGRRGYYMHVPAGSQGEVSVGDTIVELE